MSAPGQSQIRETYKKKLLGGDYHLTPQLGGQSHPRSLPLSLPLSPGTCAATEVRPVTAVTSRHHTSPDYRQCLSAQTLRPDGTGCVPGDDTLRLFRGRRAQVAQLRRLELCQVTLPSKRPASI